MKSRIIALSIAIAFLFAGFNVSLAQVKNVKKQVKQKTETIKQDVKKKTEEGMKTQTETATKKVEKTKERVVHHKTHKVLGEKIKKMETKKGAK